MFFIFFITNDKCFFFKLIMKSIKKFCYYKKYEFKLKLNIIIIIV